MTRWRFKLLLLVLIGIVITVFLIQPSHGARKHQPPAYATNYKKTVLTVGYLTAIHGEGKEKQGLAVSGAITLALSEVNHDPYLLPNVTLALRWNDTRGDTVIATRAITEMICDGVATIFGPEGTCHVEAIVSQSRNIPMISYKCSDYMASSIPTFARTEPPDTQVTKSVISLLHYYGWKKFSIIYEEASTTVAKSLTEQAKSKNMTINHFQQVIDNHKCCEKNLACCRSSYWHQLIQNTKNGTRIYVFLGTSSALYDMMVSMDTMQLFSKGEYMVIFVDTMTYSPREAHRYLYKTDLLTKLQKCTEIENFEKRGRSLLVVVATPPTDNYEKFTQKVNEFNSKEPFNFTMPSLFTQQKNYTKFVTIYAAYLYDSVKLYAWALDKLLKEEERPLTDKVIRDVASNGTRIIETIIKNRTYKSVTGSTIKIDSSGDSEGNFSVLALKPYKMTRDNFSCDLHMVPVAYFQQGENFPEYKIINASWRIDWPGNEKPVDQPICGFNNELCPKDDTHITSLVVAGALGLLLFCSAVVTLSIYRKWKIELEIEGLLWKIDSTDIKGYFNNDIVSSPSKLSLVSAASFGSRCSNQVFTTTGKFRGVVVRIKELKFARKRDISRDIMKEMRLLRDLRHDNINSFIGACVEPMRILLVTDYCAKGSLYDIIENEDIKLDDLFIASLIHDLIKGMIYIHDSALNFHGNLKSSNCVVTSRWLLQVTDFGLHDLRHCAENESIGEHQYYRSQFWKAPEILRDPSMYGSQKADTYAFAIILYEVIGRKGPFGQIGYEPKEIIEMVKHEPSFNDDPFRPDIECITDSDNSSDYIINCIVECWDENPEVRPDFKAIRNRLKKMRGGKSKNIMDQMMEMMEKYANNLEDIVNERTRLLCEEKKKTEDLLYRMLPKTVAANLTKGHGVEPVSYSSVTIYFSDIVGFTAMSAESSPLQVVNFLNDLYTVFDRIIKGYDVYKVETIGDAYMVVSGLPIKNDIRHVGEIASMSLDLLSAVRQHKISHRPNETLKLRIGMHTGPVVAGVVGLTMPRYCLFGDTVNTASRMESTGEALKIHISAQCKEALERLGGYEIESRGQIELKGKGKVTTYWLIGATDKAIKRREVNLNDLPPLFCRPRRSPKLNSDSRQPSFVGEKYFGNTMAGNAMSGGGGGGSRRQSNVPRFNDNESVSSLQGSLKRVVEYSPKSSQRKQLCRTPLYLSENSRTNLEQDAALAESFSFSNTSNLYKAFAPPPLLPPSSSSYLPDDEFMMQQYQMQSYDAIQKPRPFSLFRPHRILCGRGSGSGGSGGGGGGANNNDEYRAFLSTFDLNYNVANRLRESKSLDLIPINQHININNNNNKKNNNSSNASSNSQLRYRNQSESKRLRDIVKCASEHSACSLDGSASVSMISRDPMPSTLPSQPQPQPPPSSSTPPPFNLDRIHANFELGSRLLCSADSDSSSNIDRPTATTKKATQQKSTAALKGTTTAQNNCNGPLMEDAHCPLLYRNPQDDCVVQQKRWRSLDNVQEVQHLRGSSGCGGGARDSIGIDGGDCGTGDTDISAPKKSVNRGTIRTWLVNLFQGNGFSDASLRKAGVVQNRSFKGFSGVSELPAPEHESIV